MRKHLLQAIGLLALWICADGFFAPIGGISSARQIQTFSVTEIPFWHGFIDSIASISSPAFLSPTQIIFGDLTDHRVVIVDSAEQTMRSIGRSGAGPGEFEEPASIAINPSGGFTVWDSSQLRLSLFDESFQFVKMLRISMAVSWHRVSMRYLNDGTLIFVPGSLYHESEFSEQVVIIPPTFDTYSLFPSPCGIEIEDERIASVSDFCERTVGIGSDQTILIVNHHDYRIKRYSKSGDLLWDSGSLDPEFRLPSIRAMNERFGVTQYTHNIIFAVHEFIDIGFLIGATFQRGVYEFDCFIDIRSSSGDLIQRVPIPDGLWISDFLANGESLYVLGYHPGRLNLPDIRIFALETRLR